MREIYDYQDRVGKLNVRYEVMNIKKEQLNYLDKKLVSCKMRRGDVRFVNALHSALQDTELSLFSDKNFTQSDITLRHITTMTENNVLHLRNLSKKSLDDLKRVLVENNGYLYDTPEEDIINRVTLGNAGSINQKYALNEGDLLQKAEFDLSYTANVPNNILDITGCITKLQEQGYEVTGIQFRKKAQNKSKLD